MDETDHYDRYLFAMGRLCAVWPVLEREAGSLVGALLNAPDDQAACLATEIRDLAPRCRLIRTLARTIPSPEEWRVDIDELCNIVTNELGPLRNRIIHDRFGTTEDDSGKMIVRLEQRAKLGKP